ncbi:MAG TPA: 1-deoxy-D-xylulose-5-phosphate synthase [Ruminococcaceae bacterium]|nr:1-deoxy-D-xylulose-5-phosphate synthase [Oscillospiraceae bacterium]
MLLSDNISPEYIKSLDLAGKKQLCDEIRAFLIEKVSGTGGHLASNLGTVELTVALHSVFSTPDDKIVFDVGHQSYTHKIITGRYGSFGTLRSAGGISGFPRSTESEHDAFIGGHSSISVSAALGIAKAMKLEGKPGNVVAVIGDGALTGGEAYEGLNNIGHDMGNLIIVLNDNEMSISRSKGTVADYLTRMRSTRSYYDKKEAVKEFLSHSSVGKEISKSLSGTKDLVKFAIYQSNIFESLGLKYYGPVNGHDIGKLIEMLEIAKITGEPCIVHVKTKKGKGYKPAELNSGEYHGIPRRYSRSAGSRSFSEIAGRKLAGLAENDERICAVTAAMKYATGMEHMAQHFPERFFDVGIAEQHALTFSCGLASQGMLPVFAVYSTFLQRCCDQLLHDAAIEKKHIVLFIDRAGLVGEDGETHQGIYDVPMLTGVPGTEIWSPFDEATLSMCIEKAVNESEGIAAVRYPRGACPSGGPGEYRDIYYSGKTSDTLVVTYGRLAQNVSGIDGADTLTLLKIFPIPEEAAETAAQYKRVLFFEEGMKNGGIGEKFLYAIYERGFSGKYRITALDFPPAAADVETQLYRAGLDRESIVRAVNEENRK